MKDKNKLTPQECITNVVSTTQNSLGPVAGILTTTVQFVVFDFEEFESGFSINKSNPDLASFLDTGM